MAVDLGDFLEQFEVEINPPGENVFPNLRDEESLQRLISGFWEARFDGLLANFTANDDGVITPIATGGDDITRDEIQLVIFYAGYKSIITALRNISTSFRAQAGSVSFERQQSANLLGDIAKDLISRRNLLLTRLSDIGSVPSYVTDMVIARDQAIRYGDLWYVGG